MEGHLALNSILLQAPRRGKLNWLTQVFVKMTYQ